MYWRELVSETSKQLIKDSQCGHVVTAVSGIAWSPRGGLLSLSFGLSECAPEQIDRGTACIFRLGRSELLHDFDIGHVVGH